jgi:hypothetical protein
MTKGEVVQRYRLFFFGKKELSKTDEIMEFAVLYPSYNMLFYGIEKCFSWVSIKEFIKSNDYIIYEATQKVNETLTIEEFESKWVHPSRSHLKREPLSDRKINGWVDEQGYPFCSRQHDDHIPPSKKLTVAEKMARSDQDVEAVANYQADRKKQRLEAVQKKRPTRVRRKRTSG